jgi:hypothetical protein
VEGRLNTVNMEILESFRLAVNLILESFGLRSPFRTLIKMKDSPAPRESHNWDSHLR